MSHRIQALLQSVLFEGMSETEVSCVLSEAHIEKFASGETILAPCSPEKRIGIVCSGEVTVRSYSSPENTTLRTMHPSEPFGIASLYATGGEYKTYIEATTAAEILFLPFETVDRLIAENATFRMNYIQYLNDRICFLNTKIAGLTAGSAESKLAFHLVGAMPNGGVITLENGYTHLSSVLGVGRASLYRAMDALEKEGAILRSGKQISVLSPEKLHALCC